MQVLVVVFWFKILSDITLIITATFATIAIITAIHKSSFQTSPPAKPARSRLVTKNVRRKLSAKANSYNGYLLALVLADA